MMSASGTGRRAHISCATRSPQLAWPVRPPSRSCSAAIARSAASKLMISTLNRSCVAAIRIEVGIREGAEVHMLECLCEARWIGEGERGIQSEGVPGWSMDQGLEQSRVCGRHHQVLLDLRTRNDDSDTIKVMLSRKQPVVVSHSCALHVGILAEAVGAFFVWALRDEG